MGGIYPTGPRPCKSPAFGAHARIIRAWPDTEPAGSTRPGARLRATVQIRTFLIADVRGYTLFTQERGRRGRREARREVRGHRPRGRRGARREPARAARRRGALRLLVGPGSDPNRGRPAAAVRRGDPRTAGAAAHGRDRARCRRGGRGPGWLPRRRAEPGRPTVRPGTSRRDPRVTRGHAPRTADRRRPLRGSRFADVQGISDPVVVVRVVPEGADPMERLQPFAPPAPPPPEGVSGVWVADRRDRRWSSRSSRSRSRCSRPDDGAEVDIGTNSVARMNADDGSVELAERARPAPGRERDRVREPVGRAARPRCRDPPGPRRRLGHGHDPGRERSPPGVAVGEGVGLGDERGRRHREPDRSPTRTRSARRLRVGSAPTGIAVGDGVLWIADSIGGALLRVDPTTEEIVEVAARRPALRRRLHAGRRVGLGRAEQRRPRSTPTGANVVFTQQVGSGPTAVVAAFGSIWVANHLDGTVTRLEPSTGASRRRSRSDRARTRSSRRAGSLWVANEFDDAVVAIDPATNDVEQTVPVGGAAASLASRRRGSLAGRRRLGHRASRRDPDRLSSEVPAPESLDPAVVYDTEVLADPDDHERRAARVQEGRRPGRSHARPGPRVGAARRVGRRSDVPVPAPRRDPLLDRRARPTRGLPAVRSNGPSSCTRPGPS